MVAERRPELEGGREHEKKGRELRVDAMIYCMAACFCRYVKKFASADGKRPKKA